MPLRRRRSLYQQLIEFERGRVVGLREGGFFFRDIAKRLVMNVSIAYDCWQQWSKEGIASRRPGSGWHLELRRGKTTGFDVKLWCIILRLRHKFELQLAPQ
ncbi:hypothetical protein AVEN_179509-1 [Araneus ventricosus]|uniref:Transposase Tc1-like domain-containing protein n=1 Tax=Araneus ventricosus TaxID=182803 RepID=A0A4Y2IWB8_ARAVE|nr:hypothetical protein AVEN_179509-1 [Araneus ventricosus]